VIVYLSNCILLGVFLVGYIVYCDGCIKLQKNCIYYYIGGFHFGEPFKEGKIWNIYILIRRDIYEVYIEPFNIYINYYREILLFINNKRSIIHTSK
jgi:hypothetical protein